MNNWFNRFLTGKKKGSPITAAAPPDAPDASADSVAQRRSGNQFLDHGDLRSAIDCYQKAVASDPNSVDAYTSLGYALKEVGDLTTAQAAFQRAAQLQSENFDAVYLLGQTCNELRQYERAVAHFEKALSLQPTFEPLHGELCQALFQINAVDRACDVIVSAILKYPKNALFHFFLGNLQSFRQAWPEAADSYTTALRLKPDLTQAHANMAAVFRAQGDLDAAIQSFRKALTIEPDSAEICGDLGAVYLELGRYREAEESSRKALSLRPLYPSAQNNLGMALMSQGRLLEAEKHYQIALSADPDSDVYLSNLGGSQLAQGRLSEAVASFRRAIQINPRFTAVRGNLLYALSVDSTATREQYLSEALAFGKQLAVSVGKPYSDWLLSLDDRNGTPLRIGLVSGNFRHNPVGFFLESVMANVDPARFQFVAYATNAIEDELTQRIRPFFAQWENLLVMDDHSAAKKIRSDKIHILVDLDGHTAGNRLPVFALKPAPVQVSWLGYWASTGLTGMDYILADEIGVPLDDIAYFTETVRYLPETRLCFTAPRPELPINPLPAIQNGFVTFACFQARTKVNDKVLGLWGQILQAIPNSRLRMASNQTDDAGSLQQFHQRLRRAGIDPARVFVSGPVSREKYLASYALVDIVLDTFPYTGGTTTCEALWMGVPTLTLSGGTMIARQGAAMLTCVGLYDWIASDEADYVAKAVSQASDLDGLAVLRRTLRSRSLASTLFDAPRFVRNLENAFRAMWRQSLNLASRPLPVRSASAIDLPSSS